MEHILNFEDFLNEAYSSGEVISGTISSYRGSGPNARIVVSTTSGEIEVVFLAGGGRVGSVGFNGKPFSNFIQGMEGKSFEVTINKPKGKVEFTGGSYYRETDSKSKNTLMIDGKKIKTSDLAGGSGITMYLEEK
jgi:hypothetical protein